MNEPHSHETGFTTRAVHGRREVGEGDPLGGTIVQTSSFALFTTEDGIYDARDADYTRVGNPTFTALEGTLAALHGAQYATVYSSGIAAISAVGLSLKSGDRVLFEANTYGCTLRLFRSVLEKFGVEAHLTDLADPAHYGEIERLRPALVWIESPTNPLLKVLDIRAIAERTHAAGAELVVDNTFASPFLQRPLELGADLVVESLTKYANGHSTAMGGAVLTDADAWRERLDFQRKAVGLQPGPLDAFLTSQGLKTLELRMRRHAENALAVARYLEEHPRVRRVRYPFLPSHPQHELAKAQMRLGPGIVTADLDLPASQAVPFAVALRPLFQISHSVGAVESQVSVPALMSHASLPPEERLRLGITDTLVRLSVGIEDPADLIAALSAAFASVS